MPSDKLATRAEVAKYFRVSVKTLDNWRKRGYGPPARKYGRAVRYRWAEVLAFNPSDEDSQEVPAA